MNLTDVLFHLMILIELELLLHLQLKDEDLLILMEYECGVIFDVTPIQNPLAKQVEEHLSHQKNHEGQDFVSNNSILQIEQSFLKSSFQIKKV